MTRMTKYQLEHFESKVKRNFDPLIAEQDIVKFITRFRNMKQLKEL